MTPEQIESWLRSYGDAWEKRDARKFVSLFSADVRYHWTPFEKPKEGREAVASAFASAVEHQQDIHFDARLLSHDDEWGVAHWRCTFDRVGEDYQVHLDGIFELVFAADGSCRVFKEWWHSDESLSIHVDGAESTDGDSSIGASNEGV